MKISLKGVSFDDTFKARKAARVPKWFPKWRKGGRDTKALKRSRALLTWKWID